MTCASEVMNSWQILLQEIELARHYPLVYAMDAFGRLRKNPLLEDLLPTLLYLKMVAILDDALICYIDQNNLEVPAQKYRHDLNGRIEFLIDSGYLSDGDELHRFRIKRNDMAHKTDAVCSWGDLDADLAKLDHELQHLSLVTVSPKYEFYAEKSAARASDDPSVLCAFDYRIGVKADGKPAVGYSWTENILKSDDSNS